MNESISDLRNFFRNVVYVKIQDDLLTQLHTELDGEAPDFLCQLDLNGLKAAALSLSEIKAILYSDQDSIKDYVLLKIQGIEKNSNIQEYAENEIPDEQDFIDETGSSNSGGAPDSFLFGHLVEYSIMKSNPKRMNAYLKENDIPFAKKFEKDLLQFFELSQKK